MKTNGKPRREPEEAAIRVKIPAMPPEELAVVTEELGPVPQDLARWIELGRIGSPVAVVSDSRHPELEELEEAELVFCDRDAGYAKRLARDGRRA